MLGYVHTHTKRNYEHKALFSDIMLSSYLIIHEWDFSFWNQDVKMMSLLLCRIIKLNNEYADKYCLVLYLTVSATFYCGHRIIRNPRACLFHPQKLISMVFCVNVIWILSWKFYTPFIIYILYYIIKWIHIILNISFMHYMWTKREQFANFSHPRRCHVFSR